MTVSTMPSGGHASAGADGISLRHWICAMLGAIVLHAGAAGLVDMSGRQAVQEPIPPPPMLVVLGAAPLPNVDMQAQAQATPPPVAEPPPAAEVAHIELPEIEESDAVIIHRRSTPIAEPPPTPTVPRTPPKTKPKPSHVDRLLPAVRDEETAAAPSPAIAQPPATNAVTGAPAAPAMAPAPSVRAPGAVAAEASWQARLMAHLERHKRYPASARSSRQEGTVHLEFLVDRLGQVLSAKVVRGSGFAALDDEALAMLRRAVPLPQMPPEMPESQALLALPLRFALR